VTERYKVRGGEFRAQGYNILADADGASF